MTSPSSSSTSQQSDGIDIRDALSVLSARAKRGGDSEIASSSVPDELKKMGQKIDIADQMEFAKPDNVLKCDCAGSNVSVDDIGDKSNIDDDEREKHEAMKQERERRGEEIRSKLLSINIVDLLGMIFRAQEERVATYKLFEG